MSITGNIVIGISTEIDIPERVAVKRKYVDAVIKAGGIPFLLPFKNHAEDILRSAVSVIDGLLLTGGGDIHPSLYGEEPIPECSITCRERDAFDYTLLRLASERRIPVLGICRGMQIINTYFGGTLFQDLPTQKPSELCHKSQCSEVAARHRIRCLEGGILHAVTGKEYLEVCSIHHQAVCRIAEGFNATAFADDGVIESIESNARNIWGVQFHPEITAAENNKDMQRIFKHFINQTETERLL